MAGIAASLFIPRMVHAMPKPLPHPHWNQLLNHIDRNPIEGEFGDGRLRSWVHGLVLHPTRPQQALLLTGPEAEGKNTFHDAMGLLLPEGGVVRYPTDLRYPKWPESDAEDFGQAEWQERLRLDVEGRDERDRRITNAWLIVIHDVPALHLRMCMFEKPRYRNGRFLKWSLVHEKVLRPLPNTLRFHVNPPAIMVPKADLIRRLEDEREAFKQTLLKYAA